MLGPIATAVGVHDVHVFGRMVTVQGVHDFDVLGPLATACAPHDFNVLGRQLINKGILKVRREKTTNPVTNRR